MHPFILYLFIINAAGFLLMLTDKYKAQNKLWRIPEAVLLGVAVLGGSLGSLAGMYAVRHKTKRPRFTLGIPVVLTVQIIVLILIFK